MKNLRAKIEIPPAPARQPTRKMNYTMTLEKQNHTLFHATVGLTDVKGRFFNLPVIIHATEREVKTNMKEIQKGILDAAARGFARDGDSITVKKVATGFDIHFKQGAKPFGSGTEGGNLLKMCKWIEAHSTYNSNDLIRLLMTNTDCLTPEFVGAVFGKMNSLLPKSEFITIKKIPKPDRNQGQCYGNAWDEFSSTGNEPMIVMDCHISSSGYASVVPHAINYDAGTDEYYDTSSSGYLRSPERMGWIIKRGIPLMKWYKEWDDDWRKAEKFADSYGGYNFVWVDDRLITLHTKGIDCDRIDEEKTLQSVVVESMAQWSPIVVEKEMVAEDEAFKPKTYPCPDCEFCKKPKTWEQTKYIKNATFMNKDACLECYEADAKKEEEQNAIEVEKEMVVEAMD